jgi:hypothetical protein
MRHVATMVMGPRERIVELAGLPGAGKTTVCDGLASRLGAGHLSVVGSRRRWLRRTRAYWFFAPAVCVRYLPTLRLARRGEGAGLLTLLRILSMVHAESFLVRVEATVRRKLVVSDEGFIQRGLSICMRVPAELRREIWRSYLSRVPTGGTCVVLTCSPVEALRRAKRRPKGLSPVLREPLAGAGAPDGNALSHTYAGLDELLRDRDLGGGWRRIDVSTDIGPEATADALMARLEALAHGAELAVFTRHKTREGSTAEHHRLHENASGPLEAVQLPPEPVDPPV